MGEGLEGDERGRGRSDGWAKRLIISSQQLGLECIHPATNKHDMFSLKAIFDYVFRCLERRGGG
uniref:Uncharacterized protein n=1 Tax=Anopheles arabiensis TaxID=7173 RepID=A0A182IHF9_ANOAR